MPCPGNSLHIIAVALVALSRLALLCLCVVVHCNTFAPQYFTLHCPCIALPCAALALTCPAMPLPCPAPHCCTFSLLCKALLYHCDAPRNSAIPLQSVLSFTMPFAMLSHSTLRLIAGLLHYAMPLLYIANLCAAVALSLCVSRCLCKSTPVITLPCLCYSASYLAAARLAPLRLTFALSCPASLLTATA